MGQVAIDVFFATKVVDESGQQKYKSKTAFFKERNNELRGL
jgi:hypothetical protein